ncbi:MAG: pectate lyase [Rubripirellula sp.]
MTRFLCVALLCAVPCCLSVKAGSPAEDLTKKPDDWFRGADGKEAMSCILSWQSEHGDWPKNKDTTRKPYTGDRDKLKGTFDNGATTGELRALARAICATDDARYKRSFLVGFDHILAAQYANGGWPQYFPLSSGYHRHITFNDNSMVRILEFLTDAEKSDEFGFLDQDRRGAAGTAVKRGIECIVKCQVVVDGKRTVWCAQHDEVTLAPVKARSYELASLSGAESAGILKYLMKLEEPSQEVIQAVRSGAAWFKSVRIDGLRYNRSDNKPSLTADPSARPLWARFYEIESNRPFFCDRDGIPKYDVDEIGKERREGYSWYGSWGDSLANAYAKWPYR